jgi:hypothetical protein
MEVRTSPPITTVDLQSSGVSWPAIAAGAVTASALTLFLVALGAGLGLSSISPWAGSGVSSTTFKVGTGIYLCCMAVMASAVGGYLAARLRTKWEGIDSNEVFFRDTAHGLVAWAFATVLSATALGAATTHIASGLVAGAGAGVGQAAQNSSPADIYVDRLFRTDASTAGTTSTQTSSQTALLNQDAARGEITRLWTSNLGAGGDLNAADRGYVARVIASRTGISQADAEKRVGEVIAEAKQAADQARRAAAQLALWLAASLLLGAFASALAAVEGGQLRDGTWNGRILTPRSL